MKPWAIYTRVSTEDQAAGVSLDAQLTACRAYAVARGWTVGPEISDPGASAATLKRPGMQDALAALRAGTVAGIIAWRLDRLTRSVRDLLTLLDLTTELDVGIVSVTESLDTTTPMGRFVVHLLGAIAQWERETIGARVKSAMAHARSQGYWLGHAVPAGCKVVPDGKRKRLVRGEQADEVAKAWGWVLTGSSLRDVAMRFKAAGVKPTERDGPGPRVGWTPVTVRNLLLSHHTVGLLVDGATHALVRQTLASRNSPHHRGPDANPGGRALQPSFLAGIIRCPTCDAACVQVRASGNGGSYRYFRCTARVKGLCVQKDFRCEPIEAQVLIALTKTVRSDGEYRQAVRAHLERSRGMLDQSRAEREGLIAERERLSVRVGELTLQTDIGSSVWSKAMKALGVELDRVERRLDQLTGTIAAGEVSRGSLDVMLAEIEEGVASLNTATHEERTRVMRVLVAAVRLHGKEVVTDLYPPDDPGSCSGRKNRTTQHGTRTIRVHVLLT